MYCAKEVQRGTVKNICTIVVSRIYTYFSHCAVCFMRPRVANKSSYRHLVAGTFHVKSFPWRANESDIALNLKKKKRYTPTNTRVVFSITLDDHFLDRFNTMYYDPNADITFRKRGE